MSFLALAIATLQIAPTDAAEPPQDVLKTPQVRAAPSCACPEEVDFEGAILLRGVVVDAEVMLSADGRSARDRQATIFAVDRGGAWNTGGRARVFHSTNEARCGVAFDYGRQYEILVRKDNDGGYKTDACLIAAGEAE